MNNPLLKAGFGTLESTLSQGINNGMFRVTSNAELFVDFNNHRLHLGSVVLGLTETQIRSLPVANIYRKIYISDDTNTLFWYNTTAQQWVVVGGDHVSLADVATKATQDADGNVIVNTYETKVDATAKKTELDAEITDIRNIISQIHSFEIRKVASYQDLPVPGASNVIYFVPKTAESGNSYDEYIWITDEMYVPAGGYYECIGSTEAALEDYYTKEEIDFKIITINNTINDAITSLEAEDVAINDRIDDLSATVTANKTAADQTQADLDILEATVSNINSFNTWYGTELPRIEDGDQYTIYFVPVQDQTIYNQKYNEYIFVPQKQFEHDTIIIAAHYEKISNFDELLNYYTKAEVDAMIQTITNEIVSLRSRIGAIEEEIGDGTGSGDTITDRLNTAETDINNIQTELGNHTWQYAGSDTEGGAAINVVQAGRNVNVYQDILIANGAHDAIEYAEQNPVRINPATGTVKANKVEIGACTLAYDDESESLTVNF